jgi:trimethylamine--corrinoid protein Co-methyltransferase
MTAARLTVWDEAACSRAHAAALEILERVGVEVHHEAGVALFRKAGARIEHTRVRLPGELVEQALATAPRSFPLRGRDGDGALDLEIRNGRTYFGSGSDCLYVRDPHSGERRRAVVADVETGAAVAERLSNIDFAMSMWLPEDAPLEVVELVQLAAMLTYTRKPIVVSSPRGGDAMREQVEMAAVCGGADSLACLTMSSPSLVLDEICVEKTLSCAELKVPMVLETGISLGSTGSASLQTAAATGHAETMATLVLHQLTNPGAPFICGSGISQLDMRTFVDLYSAPESALGSQLQLDLAQFLSLPTFDYAGCTDAKSHDEQWGAEMMSSTLLGALSGGTLLHDVGYLEAGMLSTYEGLVMGDDLAGFARALIQEVPVDESTLFIDELAEIGPGGVFLGSKLTRRRCHEWWRSELFDGSNFDQWQASGGHTLGDRLRARTLDLLADARDPVVDSDATSELATLIEQARKRMASS